MLDPFTSLGVASGVLQFIDFASELLKSSTDIYTSSTGVTKENENLESVCVDLRDLAQNLITSSAHQLSADEALGHGGEALQKLAAECAGTADELVSVLQSLASKKHPQRKLISFYHALRGVWSKSKVKDLELRLDRYRNQLALRIAAITR